MGAYGNISLFLNLVLCIHSEGWVFFSLSLLFVLLPRSRITNLVIPPLNAFELPTTSHCTFFFWYSKCIHLDLSTLEFIYLYLGFVWYSHSSLSPSSLLEERFIYGTVYLKIKPSNIHLKTMFFSMNSILLKSLVAQATCIGQKKKKKCL